MKKLQEKETLCVRKRCPYRGEMQNSGHGMIVCCALALTAELKAAGMPPPMIHAPFGDRCRHNPSLAEAA